MSRRRPPRPSERDHRRDPERVERRRASVPRIEFPAQLPISDRIEELATAIRDNQVVIVAGETGSGKSTQLPKLCLQLGRGIEGLIGHTQPRRVAARTIAERVAEEVGTELGGLVGYTVRFTDRVGDGTLVQVMTDGILLGEIQRDRRLSKYDTLIIDEAHERSLNIDFILGYLAQLLPSRPDLKVIITSATIDTERFAAHFAASDGTPAPIIEVSGRTYPVELRYRPYGTGVDGDELDDRDQVQAVCDAVEELAAEGPGDVLVFLSGEREIHDTADALRRSALPHTEILALYARLSSAEQHRVFEPHTGRRVVLATNVAETSLTVPGVRYVVDAGTARISRYSHRLKVQRLPIEPVSQASANQRAGRCGRVAPGICIRLYDEPDFESRPEFTDPEILRTNLASVILQMTAIELGDVAAFPFLDPPDARAIRDGVALLEELGAIEPDTPAEDRRLTRLGRRLAQLPIDPRLGRMVLGAERHGCVREVLIIVAALSIQDPRERPTDKQHAADEMHRRFATDGSDFLSLVKLWDHLKERQGALSSSQFRKLCRTEFLNYLRVREWQDLYRQLRQAAASIGVHAGTETSHPDRVHQAVLTGLLSHIGMRDGDNREFRGARNSRFVIGGGSVLARKTPAWVMAAELVETSRLFARIVAAIQPEWAERAAGPGLAKYSYGEPRWDERSGRAVVVERVSLYGLPLIAGRTIALERVDAGLARELFIRHALVRNEWGVEPRHAFVRHNRDVIESVRLLGDRIRRWHVVDEDALHAFFDKRVAADIVSTRHFDKWWKAARAKEPTLLDLRPDDVTSSGAPRVALDQWPDSWLQGELSFPITYRFDPGDPLDGAAVHIPLDVLNQVTSEGFDWQVPGFRDDLAEALVRALPKQFRRVLTPIAETARDVAAQLGEPDGALDVALSRVIREIRGEDVPPGAFDVREVADHLRLTFVIEDATGDVVATGKDLDAIRALVGGRVRAAIADAVSDLERRGIVAWDVGDLPRTIEVQRDGRVVRGYPALVDDGGSVSIRVFSRPEVQELIMLGGVRRLLLLSVPPARGALERGVSNTGRLALHVAGLELSALIDDATTAAATELIEQRGGPMWTAADFESLVALARRAMPLRTGEILRAAVRISAAAADVRARLDKLVAPALRPSVLDAAAHLQRLVRPGFIAAAGAGRLDAILRYVRGIARRLERLPENPARDVQAMNEVRALERAYADFVDSLPPSRVTAPVVELGWQLDELRVSLFAQTLGTAGPVSAKRIMRELGRLRAG